MKKTILLLTAFLVFPFFFVTAQLTFTEKEKLSVLLLKKINDHREEKGHVALKRDIALKKAAALQCEYLTQAGKLTHVHPEPEFKTVKHRVKYYSDIFIATGENVLYSKPTRLPLNKVALTKLAYDMYNSWKKSPGHYENMISDTYRYTDFDFGYDKNTRRIYAVHVFGKKGYHVPGQLSKDAFGIQKTDDYCTTLLGGKQNIITTIGNAISIEGNDIVLRYHDLDFVKEIFKETNDGIAVDLVEREQMTCGVDNQLDGSEIYDGILLKPLYRNEIIAGNRAENPKRLVLTLGKVPSDLMGKELSPNLVIIKLGMFCSYVVPAYVPNAQYALRDIEPIIQNPDIVLKTEGVGKVDQVLFDFDSGKDTASNLPEVPTELEHIQLIDIKSFTSIDGSYANNRNLHQKRAVFINDFLKSKIDFKEEVIHIDAKENWELCDYHLELFGLEDVRSLEKEKIRRYINTHKNSRWKRALTEQRKSKAIIYQKMTWKVDNPQHFYFNLMDGLINDDYKLANKALYEIYKDTTNSYFLGEDFIMDRLFDKKELVQNVAALMLKDIHGYSRENIVFFVRTWLSKPEELSTGAQKNLLNLYTITGRNMLQFWDVSVENLSKVMHPDKVDPLFDNYKSKDVVSPLFLNFHMMRIRYFSQMNKYEEIGESFDFITDYFREQATTVEDDIALSLFFNSWSRYDLTIEQLQDRLWDDKLNEASAFILAKTLMAFPYAKTGKPLKESRLFAVHKKALSYNKKNWCLWLNFEFQNLRMDSVKNLYCKTCNE